jgi:dihydrolipoamide dehydrogenase
MSDYDVVVIGAGPAGYVNAIRTAQLGLKTAIVDGEWLGGVCLNIGCIPSKSLLKNAEVAHTLRHRGKELGFSFDNLELDFSVAVKRSRQVSKRLTRGVGFLMRKNNIDVHMGWGKLASTTSVEVTGEDGEVTTLNAKNIVVATGAKVGIPPGWEIDGEKVLTYREAILQTTRPESAVIVGGGAIGVEFATVWDSYGSDVTIVEMLERLVPNEDEEVSAELQKAFNKAGITTLLGHGVKAMDASGDKVKVTVTDPEGGEQVIEVDQVLVATGFRPNSDGLGLAEVGVELSERRNAVVIDERMATNVPGIWAVGDVTDKLMLAHVGSAQALICAENIAGVETHTLDYVMMPRATYCSPQVASFGLTEAQAQEQGHDVKVGRFPFQANGKALGLGDYGGWVKIITDSKYGELLGAHMIGPEVTELLPELTLAQMMELTAEEVARNVHAHPSLSEVLMEAGHDAVGHPIHM